MGAECYMDDFGPSTIDELEHPSSRLPRRSDFYLTSTTYWKLSADGKTHVPTPIYQILYFNVEKGEWQDSKSWKVKTPERWKEWL